MPVFCNDVAGVGIRHFSNGFPSVCQRHARAARSSCGRSCHDELQAAGSAARFAIAQAVGGSGRRWRGPGLFPPRPLRYTPRPIGHGPK